MRNLTRRSPVAAATGRRAFRVVLAAGAVALLAAGCGSGSSNHTNNNASSNNNSSSSSGVSPLHAIQLAADTAKAVNSETATISSQTQAHGVTFVFQGTLAVQMHPTFYVSADFSKFSGATSGMREVVTPNAAYLQMAPLAEFSHKPWVEIPLNSASASAASLRSVIQQAENDSPLTQTQMLAAATNVTKMGTGTLNGVQVTEYKGTYPLTAALGHVPASERAGLKQGLATIGVKDVNFEVWLDSSQQVRKVVVSLRSAKLNQTTTILVTSVNQQIKTWTPPASEVGSLPHGF
jgi:hypothetical protein